MKNARFKKSVFAILFVASCVSLQAFAQADSTSGNKALRGRPVLPLQNQERETPVTNNITQVTQVIQPNITQVSASGSGFRFGHAYASCGGGTVVGGGGYCDAANGYASMPTSQPNGNGWQVVCDAFQGGNVTAVAVATCSN
jgi:hypothetical protein